MPAVALYNTKGDQIGNVDLTEAVFGAEVNQSLMHQAVVMYLAAQRRGTASVKTRGEVRGGGRKPWRQKGTGRARIGTIRAPHWTGGGTVFGPTPRDYTKKMNKKARRQAIRSALSAKVAAGELIVVDELQFDKPKTKEMVGVLQNIKAGKKVLVVTPIGHENVVLSARNIPSVYTAAASMVNVYQVLNCDSLVMTKEAVQKVEEVFA
ncbi:50S ribosomal protein L4 [Clostridium sp. 'deep sea']|jgi:large subunit ribosomal protein L4|uniref:50S ribosomal protein L4 n=1 Tax=Clostridium sp. 'deep sea' TaxID=2779445 RepID=UPI00189684FE|nr:50S ribosomal protein L4 [Clostridium sp. 'deep sea']QOR34579.1 50S ribosomal protein L4 [Clostridium sp. 'deep sea']